MTRVERAADEVAAGEVRWRTRGVPVKAVAVATTRARRRAVMADLMVVLRCVKFWGAGGEKHWVRQWTEGQTFVCPSV